MWWRTSSSASSAGTSRFLSAISCTWIERAVCACRSQPKKPLMRRNRVTMPTHGALNKRAQLCDRGFDLGVAGRPRSRDWCPPYSAPETVDANTTGFSRTCSVNNQMEINNYRRHQAGQQQAASQPTLRGHILLLSAVGPHYTGTHGCGIDSGATSSTPARPVGTKISLRCCTSAWFCSEGNRS
jgi:hypothetical protein